MLSGFTTGRWPPRTARLGLNDRRPCERRQHSALGPLRGHHGSHLVPSTWRAFEAHSGTPSMQGLPLLRPLSCCSTNCIAGLPSFTVTKLVLPPRATVAPQAWHARRQFHRTLGFRSASRRRPLRHCAVRGRLVHKAHAFAWPRCSCAWRPLLAPCQCCAP